MIDPRADALLEKVERIDELIGKIVQIEGRYDGDISDLQYQTSQLFALIKSANASISAINIILTDHESRIAAIEAYLGI